MELRIINTNGTAPYGLGEIMHSEPVATLNEAEHAFAAWCETHVREGESLPRGIVVDEENTYDAVSGELIAD